MAQATHAELLERALELPAGDRLALATELLESVEGPADPEWTAAWAAELDRRVRDLDSGAVKPIPWQQVKSDFVVGATANENQLGNGRGIAGSV